LHEPQLATISRCDAKRNSQAKMLADEKSGPSERGLHETRGNQDGGILIFDPGPADSTSLAYQYGSSAGTNWIGTSWINVRSPLPKSSIPACSEITWPSMMTPFGMPRETASNAYSTLSKPPSASCCSPPITTSTSGVMRGVA